MQILERADIESITFGGHDGTETLVRGYQNYNIADTNVTPINNPGPLRPWTDTLVKSADFERIFSLVNPRSYADFGSNLGYYVFKSALNLDTEAVGVDYNPEYVSVCDAIRNRHAITQSKFLNTNLEGWCQMSDTYDFMTVFNVIHHLYNRTEKYMDMQELVGDFAKKADVILFEVPTERDKKGHKWTMDTGYTEALFYETACEVFTQVEHMPGQTEHRPYYLCAK